MSDINARIRNTTIREYLREQEINIMQNQKCLALLYDKKRVSYNHSGTQMDWKVKKSRNSMVQYGEGGVIEFDSVNRWETAVLDWRGYVLGEKILKKEKLRNRGKAAIVKLKSDLIKSMVSDIKYDFQRELFLSGSTPGRENSIHGFPSFLGTDVNTAQWPLPNATYAGLSTVLGTKGGAILSGAWPGGKMDPQYYYWAPLQVKWNHATFNANEGIAMAAALRQAFIHSHNTKGKEGQLDVVITTGEKYATFLDQMDDKERILVKRDGESSQLVKLGFKDVINYDGVDITYDIDIPATEGYGINVDTLELCSMQDQLFVPDKDTELATQAELMSIDFYGNLKCNPRHFVHFSNYAA